MERNDNMKILADMHIHTLASGHAYSTIDEIIRAAQMKNLELIGITDHSSGMPGSPHDYYFYNIRIIPRMIQGIKVLRGIEANIINYDGTIDVDEKTMECVDYVIASYHPPCIEFSDEKICTSGYINVMENPKVKIIGHPGDSRYPVNNKEIVLAAKRTGTLLEVNNASLLTTSFRPGVRENLVEMLKYCKQYDVQVIANTDAHISYQVGDFELTNKLFEETQFPEELVISTRPKELLEFIDITD
ncbi:MAG: phosphatase [Cellulosilyticaceae bacterium]